MPAFNVYVSDEMKARLGPLKRRLSALARRAWLAEMVRQRLIREGMGL